jgi:TM2 domain-containing membrane protein YozV
MIRYSNNYKFNILLMKKYLFFSLVITVALMICNNVHATGYVTDDGRIDALFNAAPETAMASLPVGPLASTSNLSLAPSEKTAPVALLLDFFLGGLGVHRFYLGTEVLTGVGYILTCGGIFGIVPLIDFVVLIINLDDISPFIDNPKFFMWG